MSGFALRTRSAAFRPRRIRRALFLGILALACAAPLPAQTEEPLAEAWTKLSLSLCNDAYRLFHDTAQKDPSSREARYGEALALMNRQPRSSGNLARAGALFTQLQAANPRDGIGVAALYFEARLAQAQSAPPGGTKALALYAELTRAHPASPFAQLALIKTAGLRLYDPGAPDGELTRRFAECEAFAPRITNRALLGQYHREMADAYQRLRRDDRDALRHLLASFPCGTPNLQGQADLEVRIGETARAVGDDATALAYYRRFLADFPNDIRAYAIRQFQRQLESVRPAPPAPAAAP